MKRIACTLSCCLVVSGLLLGAAFASDEAGTITVMTHDSFSASKKVIELFEKAHGVEVRFLKSGDAGAALIQAILAKNNPMADIFFGVDNTFLSRALKEDLFEPYASPMLEEIPDALKLDPGNRLLPVDYGDVCLNYDKKWFAEKGLAPPSGLSDLILPAYKGLTVVENPATSSPGLAFLLTTVGRFGGAGWLEFWKKLRANDVMVTNGWKDAYWGQFSAASKGNRPIVVSYATSPPAEVHFAGKPMEEAPTAAIVENRSAFRQVEFVGLLKGAKHPDMARKFIDFMLDKPFQEDIPLEMFVFPANRTARLPEVFVKHSRVAETTAVVSPEAIMVNRERWIEAWADAVLR